MRRTTSTTTATATTIQIIRKRPSLFKKYYLWFKFYVYYYLKACIVDYLTVASMAITREKRLYYLHTTGKIVEVTAYNYLSRVKVDGIEWALIKTVTSTGVSYTKAERF